MATKSKKRADPMPSFVPPMKAEPVKTLPLNKKGETRWGYEPKIDGHRLQLIKRRQDISVRTRNDLRPVINVSGIARQAQDIKAADAIVDGEGAAVDESGRTSWEALEQHSSNAPIVFFAFDLLYCDGRSLLQEPLYLRQSLLAEITEGSGLQLCMSLPGSLPEITQNVMRMGFEGIVAKDQQSIYRPDRRTRDWQKLPFALKQEFVIGGYKPDGDRVGSLIVGVYEGSQLKFTSKVRAGLGPTNRRPIRTQLQAFNTSRCPFTDLPTSQHRSKSSWDSGGVSAEEMHEIQWVRPHVLAVVEFRHWTSSGRLRHPEFVGTRMDKPPQEVVRET